jgi:hypothetical protein
MADQEFTAERLNSIKLVNVTAASAAAFSTLLSKQEEDRLKDSFEKNKDSLVIPKR